MRDFSFKVSRKYTKKPTDKIGLWNEEPTIDLIDFLYSEKKVVLLGSAGSGKSTVLEGLFDDIWTKKNETGLVPFLLNLNTYKNQPFEDFIDYEDLKSLPRVVFILDGLDEVVDIQKLIYELESFAFENKDLDFMYLISCRTSVYDKYVFQIQGFSSIYLNDLTNREVRSILINNFEIKPELIQDLGNYNTPYFIEKIGKYYELHNRLPISRKELWSFYINEEMGDFNEHYNKSGVHDTKELSKGLKKISLLNELMHSSRITDIEIGNFFENHSKLKQKPLMRFNKKFNDWAFIHKQVQEYFTAKVLSELNFDNVIEIIKINDVEKVHPSMINSIVFLISLLDSKDADFQRLIDWLKNNNIEILIKSEFENFSKEFRIEIFQNYFKETCIDKSFWIDNKNVSAQDLAKFGDFDENFNFLITIFFDVSMQYRVRISSLILMKKMKLPSSIELKEEVKTRFVEVLSQPNPENFTDEVLDFLCIHFSKDKGFTDSIIKMYSGDTSKMINRRILDFIKSQPDIDKYVNYLEEEFKRIYGIVPRKEEDNVLRGSSYIIDEIILQIDSTDNFLKFAKLYINNSYKISPSYGFENKFYEKCEVIDKKNNSFLSNLINDIDTNSIAFNNRFKQLVKKSKNNKLIVETFLTKTPNINSFYNISSMINDSSLDIFTEILLKVDDMKVRIESVRNYIANTNDISLARKFESKMQVEGYDFSDKLLTKEDIELRSQKYIENNKLNLDALAFEKHIFEDIKKIFEKHPEIDRENYFEISREWYDTNGHGQYIDSSYNLIHSFLIEHDKTEKATYNKLVDFYSKNEYLIKRELLQRIRNNNEKNIPYNLSDDSLVKLQDWCSKTANTINFKEIVQYHKNNIYYDNDFEKLKIVLGLLTYLDLKLDKNFLINSIPYYQFENLSNESQDPLLFLKEKINDDILFNEFVSKYINNIENQKKINYLRFVDYALKNRLDDTFKSIDYYFLNVKNAIISLEKLEQFSNLYKGKETLKKYSKNTDKRLAWDSINLLIKNYDETDYCVSMAKSHLNKEDLNFYILDAINILLRFDLKYAIELIIRSFKKREFLNIGSFKLQDVDNYNFFNFKKTFKLFYSTPNVDFRDVNFYRELYNRLVYKSSKSDDGYNYVANSLIKLREEYEKTDDELFYINNLIDTAENSYIEVKSKPYLLSKAKKIVNQYLK